ncbi:tetratricopeptide repeat protein [Melioribacteraceae bacterium 4301-Me]|uniref:tetratricopeptide repeat protein n=1 Tax=Pyranulibacter aquaticus TaxID=3163344 RepID=UPI0035984523
MRKTYIFFTLFCLSITFLKAQNLTIQNLAKTGWDAAYSLRFADAEKFFNKIIEYNKDLPYGYYNIARLHFWLYLGSNDPGEYFIFLKYSELATQKIEKMLDKDDDNPKYNYILGNIELLRAMVHAINNNALDAFWEAKNAKNNFDKTLQSDSTFYDAYMGLGLLDYALSYVPSMFKWAVNLTGLSSNKERGLKYLLLSYKKGKLDKTENAFHLAKIYTDYLANYDSASIFLNILLTKYPNNVLFLYQSALTNIKARKLDKAESSLNQIIKINNPKIPIINSLALFRKGEIYFRRNNFKMAKEEYQKFIDVTKEMDYVGIANLRIAVCNAMIDSTINNEKYFEGAKSGNPDIFEDAYAKIKSDKFKNKGFSEEYLYLITMENNLFSAKYKLVYDSLKVHYPVLKEEEERAKALAYISEACINLGKFNEAISFIARIDSLNYHQDKWIKPYSLFLLAKANYSLNNKKKAVLYLNQAENSNEFEFKDSIQALINNLKRKMKLS